jgi:hypothetical protein
MKRIILSALVALTAFGGVASADRWRDTRRAPGGVTVESRGRWDRGHWDRGNRGRWQQRQRYNHNRGYVMRPQYRYRYVRRPIYVQRPVIAYRYYNYYQRPTVLVENYSTMPGYIWVAGRWNWNGYEWIWQPGHYQPDPNAVGYYSDTHGQGYYDNPSYDPNYVDSTYSY